jgi:hypothetical protein
MGNTLRLSQAAVAGGVPVGGVDRLRILASLAHHAIELAVYSSGDGATGWRMDTEDSRLFVVLSPEPSRGFSGEGQALHALVEKSDVTARLRAMLRWQNCLEPSRLAAELNASEAQVAAALAELGTSGFVGYDLTEGKYFHRELPFDLTRITKLHPRLANAQQLVSAGHVEIETNGATAWVRGKDGEYPVRRDNEGSWRCHCPWGAKYGISRGPCKHILAVQIQAGESGE